MSIFKVTSNLKYGADSYPTGSFMDMDKDADGILGLLQAGVLVEVVGASNIAEAMALEGSEKTDEPATEPEVEPENTWDPKPDADADPTGDPNMGDPDADAALTPTTDENVDPSVGNQE